MVITQTGDELLELLGMVIPNRAVATFEADQPARDLDRNRNHHTTIEVEQEFGTEIEEGITSKEGATGRGKTGTRRGCKRTSRGATGRGRTGTTPVKPGGP